MWSTQSYNPTFTVCLVLKEKSMCRPLTILEIPSFILLKAAERESCILRVNVEREEMEGGGGLGLFM